MIQTTDDRPTDASNDTEMVQPTILSQYLLRLDDMDGQENYKNLHHYSPILFFEAFTKYSGSTVFSVRRWLVIGRSSREMVLLSGPGGVRCLMQVFAPSLIMVGILTLKMHTYYTFNTSQVLGIVQK